MDVWRGRPVAEAEKKIAGIMRSLCFALAGLGVLVLALVLVGVIDAPSWPLYLVACVVYFLFMTWREGRHARLTDTFHKYGELLAAHPGGSVAVRELAGLAQEPEEGVMKNLNEMIRRKYLPGFALELPEGRLVDQRHAEEKTQENA